MNIPSAIESANFRHQSRFVTYWDDDIGLAKLEFFKGLPFLHVELHKPFIGVKTIKKELPKVKRLLKQNGYANVCVFIPDNDEKLYRFESHCGFSEVARFSGQILMTQEC